MAPVPWLNWYKVRQNNVMGLWHGPALIIYIQGKDADDASDRLFKVPGVESDYCSCCGLRWTVDEFDAVDDAEVLQLLSKGIVPTSTSTLWESWAKEAGYPLALVIT